jgi:hypothetical protein
MKQKLIMVKCSIHNCVMIIILIVFYRAVFDINNHIPNRFTDINKYNFAHNIDL